MRFPIYPCFFVLAICATATAAGDKGSDCAAHATTGVERLQSDVVGPLDSQQRDAAIRIMIDVCEGRELVLQTEAEEAVAEAREEEREKANSWWKTSADKPGNRRLKSRTH